MNLRQRLHQFALRVLPDSLLQPLKKARYASELAGPWEGSEPDARVVRLLVRRGGVALDLGANFGKYTKLLSEAVGPSGRVHSVEPVPLTYDLLAANVRRFALDNVRTINAAISEADGEVRMQVPHYPGGGENFYEARVVADAPADTGLRTVRVPARSLDSLFADAGRVDFVKCDVEGHELACLRGASGLLASHRPAWMIEVSGSPDDPDSRAASLFALLAGCGYEAFFFDGRALRGRPAGHRSVNYFFLTPEHLERLPAAMRPACAAV